MAGGSAAAGTPNDEMMDRIERAVELPPSAAPLSEYRRYYAWAKKGRTVLVLYALGDHPERTWVAKEKMPIIIDQGCRVVVFDYDVAANTAVNLTC